MCYGDGESENARHCHQEAARTRQASPSTCVTRNLHLVPCWLGYLRLYVGNSKWMTNKLIHKFIVIKFIYLFLQSYSKLYKKIVLIHNKCEMTDVYLFFGKLLGK